MEWCVGGGLHALHPRPPTEHVDPLENADPFEDADALDELAHEIATLAAHIHAATQRLLELVWEFD